MKLKYSQNIIPRTCIGNNTLRFQIVLLLVSTLFQHCESQHQGKTSAQGSSLPHKLVFSWYLRFHMTGFSEADLKLLGLLAPLLLSWTFISTNDLIHFGFLVSKDPLFLYWLELLSMKKEFYSWYIFKELLEESKCNL